MELAICLSKFIGQQAPLDFFKPLIQGYAAHGKLSTAEAEAMPTLLNLRILSNVVFFVGRALAGEDGWSTLTNRLEAYETRVKWAHTNAAAVTQLVLQLVPRDE